MPKIPTFRTSLTRTGTRAIRREAPLTLDIADVGAEKVYEGVERLGRGVTGLGEILGKLRNEQRALNDTIVTDKIRALHEAYQKNLETELSTTELTFDESGRSSHEKISEERQNEFRQQVSELSSSLTKRGQQIHTAQMGIWGIGDAANLRASQTQILVRESRASLSLGLEEAHRSNNKTQIAIAEANFDRGAPTAWGSEVAAREEAKRTAISRGARTYIENQAVLYPETVQAALEDVIAEKKGKKVAVPKFATEDEALTYGNVRNYLKEHPESLDEKDIDDLIDFARIEAGQQEQAIEQDYWQLLRSGRYEELQQSLDDPTNPLSVKRKSWWAGQIKKHITGGEHDPAVYWPLLRRAMTTPQAVTEEEVANLVGKGINTNDYKEIMKHLEKEDDSLKADRFLIRAAQLDKLYDEGALTSLEYDIKNEKLKAFAETSPSAKEMDEFYDELVEEEKSDWVWKLLSRVAPFTAPPMWMPHRLLKEEKEPAKVSLERFTIGEVRKDAKGQSWKYKGNNEWQKL